MEIRSPLKFISKTLAIASASLLLFSSLFAQNRSTISGYVFTSDRSPVAQIPVELRNDVNGVIGRTRTDGTGRFVFFRVPNGRLSVTVLPIGTNFEEQSREVEIAGMGARGLPIPENVQIDFHLRLRRGPAPATGNEVVFAQETPEEAKRIYDGAISDLDAQRTQAGLSGLERAVEIFPTYFLALQRLGAEQIKQEKYEDAARSFEAAVAVNKRSFASWHGLALSSFPLKRWKKVIDSAEKALEIEKNSVNTLILLGISQRNLQQYPEAEKSFLRAKKLDDGKTPDLYWNMALLYAYNLKKYQDAADSLELYLKANPAVPDAVNVKKLIKQFRENRPPN